MSFLCHFLITGTNYRLVITMTPLPFWMTALYTYSVVIAKINAHLFSGNVQANKKIVSNYLNSLETGKKVKTLLVII